MALSVLIPVYNTDVTLLVTALATQLSATNKQTEIILVDDGSSNFISENKLLENIPFLSYHSNEKNKGRLISRQKLAALAQYDYLLFLDGDSAIIKDNFITTYFSAIEKNYSLVCGGRTYTDNPPADCDLMLHWKYGSTRESSISNSANHKPAFMSNNFLITRELFFQLDNNIQIAGYGHEDSWWGIQFEQLKTECININNPVLHAALEKAEIFIVKSENALSNLLLLEKNISKDLLKKHIKIFRWYSKLKSAGLNGLFLFFESIFHAYFKKNLLSGKPNLFYFDCYRLAILIRLAKSKSSIK